jgi:hypothetical protein
MSPPALYDKSKSLGSGGSMVARLKLKGIDGRAHQEWSLRLNLTQHGETYQVELTFGWAAASAGAKCNSRLCYLLVQASYHVRQAPLNWDVVGKPRRCATPTGTGDTRRQAESILWRVRVAPGRRNARKVVGVSELALKVRAIPSGDRASDWRAQNNQRSGGVV